MNIIQELKDSLIATFSGMIKSCGAVIPKLIVFVIILLIGYMISKLIKKLIKKALTAMSFDDMIKKVNMDVMLNKMKPGLSATSIISGLVYWLVMLVFITAATNYIGLDVVARAIGEFFAYLPTLAIALVIAIIGLYIADIVKNVVYTAANSIGLGGAKAIANIVYYVLAIMVVITALKQAGVDTSLITANVTMILGAILLAFAISYGFASRELVSNLLSSYYGKGKFNVGMQVEIEGEKGTVENVDSISVSIRTANGLVVIPSKVLVEKKIRIISE